MKSLAAILMVVVPAGAWAATPPPYLNYQGVLRNASNAPLDGTYDMTFGFYDAATAGNQILVDQHASATANAVTVSNGLFDVELGGGTVSDGTGPGTYTALDQVFRDYAAVWLEIQVGGETLSPRVRVMSSGYSLNAANLGGKAPNSFLDTSSVAETKSGSLSAIASDALSIGVTGAGVQVGGYFYDTDDSGYAYLGNGDQGVVGFGNFAGGYFRDADSSGYANVGVGDNGIEAYGNGAGGYFADLDSTGRAFVGDGDYGVWASANYAGGYFEDGDASGQASVGYGDEGIHASGNAVGGYFADSNNSGVAFVGYGDRGIWGKGNFAGGTFSSPDNVTYWADVSTSMYKIHGTGTNAFVQNDPYDKNKVIVYASPEGDEAAVYTRGSAKLVNGEAHVTLGDTFRLVANPDIGLTAHLTPRGGPASLWVASVTPSELVVRGPAGSNAAFDYIVYGLRIGFEELAIVQPKKRDAFLPGAGAVDAQYAGHPELRASDPLERFTAMRSSMGITGKPDLTRAHALEAAIDANRSEIVAAAAAAAEKERAAPKERTGASIAAPPVQPQTEASAPSVRPDSPSSTASSAPALPAGTSPVPVAEEVRSGDVLAIDPAGGSALRRAAAASDPGVVGIVAGEPGHVWTTTAPLAFAGTVVLAHIDASYGAILAGDLLVASPTPGYTMRAGTAPIQGTVVAKALEPLASGTGTIRVLVMSR